MPSLPPTRYSAPLAAKPLAFVRGSGRSVPPPATPHRWSCVACAPVPYSPRWTVFVGPSVEVPPYTQTKSPATAALALLTARYRSGCLTHFWSLPLLSKADFQTDFTGVFPSDVPPTSSSPSETGRSTAPAIGCGRSRSRPASFAVCHLPSCPFWPVVEMMYVVAVGLPSGPMPPA